jgi:hypothetical protein
VTPLLTATDLPLAPGARPVLPSRADAPHRRGGSAVVSVVGGSLGEPDTSVAAGGSAPPERMAEAGMPRPPAALLAAALGEPAVAPSR